MIGAYDDRLLDQWLQTREIAYMIYCLGTEMKDRQTKQKFMPLKGDKEAIGIDRGAMIKAAREKWEKIRPREKQK